MPTRPPPSGVSPGNRFARGLKALERGRKAVAIVILVYCGKAADVVTVVVDGEILVEDRRIGVDLPQLYAATTAAVERIAGK